MDQFVVPQFIDVEAKIFGPITVRQFIIMLIGGLSLVAAWKLADLALFIIEAMIIAALVFLFGFYKVNGRQFHLFLLNIVESLRRPSVRVWATSESKPKEEKIKAPVLTDLPALKPPLNRSKLEELTLIVDTGGVYRP